VQHFVDQQLDQRVGLSGGYVGGPDLSLRFGPDMPRLPGGAVFFHRLQYPSGSLGDPGRIDRRARPDRRCQCMPHHHGDCIKSAECRCGFGAPSRPLLGQGSGFVFGVAGLQCRLLGQMQRFDRCRRPAMIVLELDGKLAAAGVDVGAAGRPALVQSGVDADDLPDRPLGRVGAGPFSKPHPQGLAEVLLQRGVVDGMRKG
jgi:hypothetical protein